MKKRTLLYLLLGGVIVAGLFKPLALVHVKLMRHWEVQICSVITCPERD